MVSIYKELSNFRNSIISGVRRGWGRSENPQTEIMGDTREKRGENFGNR